VPTPTVVASIIAACNESSTDFPLPLAAHWNCSETSNHYGWTPAYWVEALQNGNHVIPTIVGPDRADTNTQYLTTYAADIQTLGGYGVPISIKHTQWESALYHASEAWLALPNADNPNVLSLEDAVTAMVCPIGATNNRTTPWSECGARWAVGDCMTQLQSYLPSPSKIIHICNNEASIQRWDDIETLNKRYVDTYGTDQTDAEKRSVIAAGYPTLYAAMIEAFRAGQSTAHWRNNSTIIPYSSYTKYANIMGRYSTWMSGASYTSTRWNWAADAWDGESASWYWTGYANTATPSSLPVGASNGLFAIEEVRAAKPNWWHELLYWDGNNYPTNQSTDYRQNFNGGVQSIAGSWLPRDYAAALQFAMWIQRPRVVREFRSSSEQKAASVSYWEALLAAVDRVWNNGTLASFWRSSELIPGTRSTMYTSNVPTEYSTVDRWYLLNTDVDEGGSWSLTTRIHVFALARINSAGDVLVYCYSPVNDHTNVTITIPDVDTITVDVPVQGAFYLRTAGGTVRQLGEKRLQASTRLARN